MWLNLICENGAECDTYNELWSNYPLHDGTDASYDDSDADEDDRWHQLRKRGEGEENTEESDEKGFYK